MVFLEPDYSQDSRFPGGDTPVPVSSSLQLQRDTNSQDMKPDLNTSLSISGEMSPLPFSMPKLERKLKDQHKWPAQTRPSLSLSIASKQPRPTSLHTSTPTRTSNIRLALHTSGKSPQHVLIWKIDISKCFTLESQNKSLSHFRLKQSYANNDSYHEMKCSHFSRERG